jgi:GDP-4-dehydro-6-deoxy-D-mannose reductase
MAAEVTIVTGAGGFAGGFLIDRLAGRGALIGWHRPGSTPPAWAPPIDWDAVDLTDREGVARAIARARPSRVFHLAGAADVGESWRTSGHHLRTNALGTHHLLAAIRHSVPACRVLVTSSAMIYRSTDAPLDEHAPVGPASPYGFSKLAQDAMAEAAARDEGLDVVIARPFNQIGPRQSAAFALSNFARQLARIEAGVEPPELRVGNIDARRDITDVRDVVAAYERLMTHGVRARSYNVCSGRAWRIRDLLDELLHLAPVRARVSVDPTRLRPFDVPIVQGNAARIRAELGWTPGIPVETSLRDMLDWWRRTIADHARSES